MGELASKYKKYAKNVLWWVLGFLFAKRKRPAKRPLDLESVKSVLVVRPDRLKHIETHDCMEQIEVDDVFQAVKTSVTKFVNIAASK